MTSYFWDLSSLWNFIPLPLASPLWLLESLLSSFSQIQDSFPTGLQILISGVHRAFVSRFKPYCECSLCTSQKFGWQKAPTISPVPLSLAHAASQWFGDLSVLLFLGPSHVLSLPFASSYIDVNTTWLLELSIVCTYSLVF